MEMRQMLERLLAGQEEMRANLKEMMARMDERMTAIQGKTDVKLEELTGPRDEMMQSAEEHHEIPNECAVVKPVRIRKRRHRGRKETARRRLEPKELNRGDRGSRKKLAAACRKASHHATVAWIKRNVSRKSWTCGNYGLRKEVAASRGKAARCAGHGREVRSRQKVAPRGPTGGAFEARCRRRPQGGMGRMDPTVIDIGGWSPGQLSPLERR
jgi:hypothetical protein